MSQIDSNAITTELTGLGEDLLHRIAGGLGFMKACAERAGIPYANEWKLAYQPDRVYPWRIVDGSDAGSSGRNVVRVLRSDGWGLLLELEAYGFALRAASELRNTGSCMDLMSPARLQSKES
jgi:hypothetical protein